MLVGLVFLSIPYVRHRAYEAFCYIHILMAIIYLALLFWHADNLLDSWAYLWAALALWLASWLARIFHYTRPMNVQNEWLSGAPATIQALPGDMTRIELLAPFNFRYTPAQHCFLRFLFISAMDNHPFTIVSAPAASKPCESDQKASSGRMNEELNSEAYPLLFLARTHAGFTRKLASYCASHPDAQLSAWIDGPYGGISRPIEHLFDDLIIIAGGTGITACLPWLTYVVAMEQIRVKRMSLRWIVKEEGHIVWARHTLQEVFSQSQLRQNRLMVEFKFYVTRNPAMGSSKLGGVTSTNAGKSEIGTIGESGKERDIGEVVLGRPSMKSIVSELVGSRKSFIIGCGPDSLRTDLGNAVAAAQSKVWKDDAQEIAMHLEAFGW
jgi:Ferric reductase NAD binding domain/FAD-binding domain